MDGEIVTHKSGANPTKVPDEAWGDMPFAGFTRAIARRFQFGREEEVWRGWPGGNRRSRFADERIDPQFRHVILFAGISAKEDSFALLTAAR